MKNEKKPDLYFSESSDVVGFTSAETSHFNDADSMTIIRELIQNSLDAVREDGRNNLNVLFKLEKCAIKDIPSIDTYKKRFELAVSTQRKISENKIPDKAQQVIDTIYKELKKEDTNILFIMDNGSGLNEKRMGALLASGISEKAGSGASGSYGVGHLSVLPASNLRYTLCGGIYGDGEKIAAGHTILASSQSENEKPRGKDGYFVNAYNKNDLFNRFCYVRDSRIPNIIQDKLCWISENGKTGSVIAIPAFNFFNDKEDAFQDSIKKAAATNFFAAIIQGNMTIELRGAGLSGEGKLDSSNIQTILDSYADNKRRKRGQFISGSRAAEAAKTLKDGENIKIDTGYGIIAAKLRLGRHLVSRVEFCRNGMHITELHELKSRLTDDYEAFNCVVLLDDPNSEVHRVFRKCEPPLHNKIKLKELRDRKDRDIYRQAMKAIRSALEKRLKKIDTEQTVLKGFFELPMESAGKSDGHDVMGAGEWEPVIRAMNVHSPNEKNAEDGPGGREGTGKGKRGGKNHRGNGRGEFKRSGNSISFDAIPVFTGLRSCEVEFSFQKEIPNAEIRFLLDESYDESCDRSNNEPFVTLKKVLLDKKEIDTNLLVKNSDGKVKGIHLERLDTQSSKLISFTFDLPEGVNIKQDEHVVLKAQIVRRNPVQAEVKDNG